MQMEHVQDNGVHAGMSAFGEFWFHLTAAVGCLPAMVGLPRRNRAADRPANRKPRPAIRARHARPVPGRGNLIEAAMLAIAVSEAAEARGDPARKA